MVQLTSEQQLVLQDQQNPKLVVAGAGTGKTTTMKEYVKAYADPRSSLCCLNPQDVLAISFTNENADHFHEVLPDSLNEVQTSTMDSLAVNMLRNLMNKLQWKVNLQIDITQVLLADSFYSYLKSTDHLKDIASYLNLPVTELTWKVFESIIDEHGVQYEMVRDLILHEFNRWQLQQVMQTQILIYNLETLYDLLVQLMDQYQNYLQPPCRLLIVDEAQDLNTAQLSLIEKFYVLYGQLPINDPRHLQIVLIGDPTQSIFRFNGSDPQELQRFVQNAGSHPLTLTKNFRSAPQTLIIPNLLLADNFDNIAHLQLRGQQKNTSLCGTSFLPLRRSGERVNLIAGKIMELVKQGIEPKDIAILARSGLYNTMYGDALADQIAQALPPSIPIKDNTVTNEINGLAHDLSVFLKYLEIMTHAFSMDDQDYDLNVNDWINCFVVKKYQRGQHSALNLEHLSVPSIGQRLSHNIIDNQHVVLSDYGRGIILQGIKRYSIAEITKVRSWHNHRQIGLWAQSLSDITRNVIQALNDELNIQVVDNGGISLDTIHGAKGSEWQHVIVLPENAGYSDEQHNLFYCLDRNHDIDTFNRVYHTKIAHVQNELITPDWQQHNPSAIRLVHNWQDQQDCAYVALTRARVHTYIVPNQYTRNKLLDLINQAQLFHQDVSYQDLRKLAWRTVPNETLLYSGYIRKNDEYYRLL